MPQTWLQIGGKVMQTSIVAILVYQSTYVRDHKKGNYIFVLMM